jgi:23S rRNA pseudouridine1911/1915/1917 synthase
MDNIVVEVNFEDELDRIDLFLAKKTNFTRSKIQNLIKLGFITNKNTNEIIKSSSYGVNQSDIFIITTNTLPQEHLIATKIDLDIIYEDEVLAVINKPAHLTVHPGAGNYDNTLANGLLYKYRDNLSSLGGNFRLGIVHRIDKDTSGLLVVVKNDEAHAFLANQFAEHSVTRRYRALVWGMPFLKSGKITGYMDRCKKNRLKMATSKTSGKLAITNYKFTNFYQDLVSLVDLQLQTGRTHQIRLHMQELGHPLLGETLYNIKGANKYYNKLDEEIKAVVDSLDRQALHAYKLGFIHPLSQEYMEFNLPEPSDMQNVYQKLNFKI